MDAQQFDRISKLFAERRLSRRRALASSGAGLAAGVFAARRLGPEASAEESTPVVDLSAGDATDKSSFLFVQSFQGGSVAANAGVDDRYTVTLNQGLGQTIYFGDRPSRLVGSAPTPSFLEGLGFSDDNPPNAAFIIEHADGKTDITVAELFNPAYDAVTQSLTYEIAPLDSWEDALAFGLQETPKAFSEINPEFGATHLFIDDCADGNIVCTGPDNAGVVGGFGSVGYCWNWSAVACVPCESGVDACPSCIEEYWTDKCNGAFPACKGNCTPAGPYLN